MKFRKKQITFEHGVLVATALLFALMAHMIVTKNTDDFDETRTEYAAR